MYCLRFVKNRLTIRLPHRVIWKKINHFWLMYLFREVFEWSCQLLFHWSSIMIFRISSPLVVFMSLHSYRLSHYLRSPSGSCTFSQKFWKMYLSDNIGSNGDCWFVRICRDLVVSVPSVGLGGVSPAFKYVSKISFSHSSFFFFFDLDWLWLGLNLKWILLHFGLAV